MKKRCNVTVFNGLPLNCEFYVGDPEPDVGIYSQYVDDLVLYDRDWRHAKWAENQMSMADWDDLATQVYDKFKSGDVEE